MSKPPSLPGFPGVAWRGVLPSILLNSLTRLSVTTVHNSNQLFLVVSSLTAKPFGTGELSWRSARIGDLSGSNGGSRTGIRQVGLSSTSIGNLCPHHLQTRPSLFSGKWIEQIGLQLQCGSTYKVFERTLVQSQLSHRRRTSWRRSLRFLRNRWTRSWAHFWQQENCPYITQQVHLLLRGIRI